MEPNLGRKFDWNTNYVYTPAGIDEVEEVEEVSERRLLMFLDVNKHTNPTFTSLRCVQVARGDSM
jgi:hypothetical protein